MSDLRCPLCLSERHFVLQSTRELPGDDPMVQAALLAKGDIFRFHACQRCELIFRSPRPTEEQLKDYYANVLPNREPEIMSALGVTRKQADERNRHRYEALHRELRGQRPRGHVVDIGGWDGSALVPWRLDGWDTTLVEPGARSRRLATSDMAAFDTAGEVQRPADIVTSYHCIEHLRDLRSWLEEVKKISRRGTLWVVEVPFELIYVRGLLGHDRLGTAGVHEEHLNFFTPASLEAVAREAGLRVGALRIVITPYWFGPTVALRLYAEDRGSKRTLGTRFAKSERHLRAKLAALVPIWRRVAGIKFRWHRAFP